MKYLKAFSFVLILAALFVFPNVASAESKFQEGSIDVNETLLYLRATEDSPIVCKLEEGARVGVYAEQGEFVRVIFGNYRGYIKREMLFVPSEDTYNANIYSDGLRVRMSPGDFSTVLSQVNSGTPVKIVDVFGEWYKVEIQAKDCDSETDITGFVSKEYVAVTDSKQAKFMLRPEMSGSRVKTLQKELKARGFLSASATGYYGHSTKQAVADFQVAARLSPDGIAGEKTLEVLYADNDIKAPRKTSGSSSGGSSSGGSGGRSGFSTGPNTAAALAKLGKVHLSGWGSINSAWPGSRRISAKVTDVSTGKTFKVTRYNLTAHADVAPDSTSDTATLKNIYGGKWSWSRRPIWVTVNGTTYAASMNGMPHGDDYNPNDGMNGQICIHFNGSVGHSSPSQDADHQAAVRFAYDVSKK